MATTATAQSLGSKVKPGYLSLLVLICLTFTCIAIFHSLPLSLNLVPSFMISSFNYLKCEGRLNEFITTELEGKPASWDFSVFEGA